MSRIIRIKEVCALVGLSRSSVLRMEKDGAFPAKVSLSVHAVGWRHDEVVAWIESRVARRG